MKTITAFVALACLAALPALAADEAKLKVIAFNATVKVEVDAAGKPVNVEAPADLPEAIRGFIEKRVRSWQYQPAKIEGVPQPATTYVAVNACAVPVPDGYRLGVDFDGNGPRVAGDKPLQGPMFPSSWLGGASATEFSLILDIAADGSGKLDRIDRGENAGRGSAHKLEPRLQQWAKTLRFDPEQIAGKPVTEKIRILVSFSQSTPTSEELQTKAKASRECQMAATGEAGLKPVALQPVVTVIPQPAG